MKLSEILDDDPDAPIQLVLVKNLMMKGLLVRAWIWIASGKKVEGVITDAEMQVDKKINRPYISVHVKSIDDNFPNAADIQRWYPTQWDTMMLTDKYAKGRPGQWWLIDSEAPDEAA